MIYFKILCALLIAQQMAYAVELPDNIQPGRVDKQFDPIVKPKAQFAPDVEQGQEEIAPINAAEIKFTLSQLNIIGSNIYTESELLPLYQEYIGKEIALTDIYRIANKITAKYRNDGYILVQAIVPPQSIKLGIVVLRIVEGYIQDLQLEGIDANTADLIRQYGQKMIASKPLTANSLERYLLLMNDLPGISARSVLGASKTTPGASDIIIVIDEDKVDAFFSYNNRGGRSFGPDQYSLGATVNNLLGNYDQTTVFINTTGTNDELHFLNVRHQEQISTEGMKLDLSFSRSDSEPGARISPRGLIDTESLSFTSTLSYPILRSRTENLTVRGNFAYLDTTTDIGILNDALEDRIRSIRVGASYDLADKYFGINILDVELSQGLDVFASTGSNDQDDSQLSREFGQDDYTKFTIFAARLQSLAPNWSLLFAIDGQYAFDSLLSPEQFGFGGSVFGRGYDSSEITGDSGIAVKLELRYNQSPNLPFFKNYVAYGFYDAGQAWLKRPSAEEKHTESAISAGIGIRASITSDISANLELAKPLTKAVNNEEDNDARLFFTLTVNL